MNLIIGLSFVLYKSNDLLIFKIIIADIIITVLNFTFLNCDIFILIK